MMKSRLSVYLDPETLRLLEAFATQRGKSKSLVAETAITAFLTPDTAERHEAAITRRLDHHIRVMERLERNLGIAIEMLAPCPKPSKAPPRPRGASDTRGLSPPWAAALPRGRALRARSPTKLRAVVRLPPGMGPAQRWTAMD
jgi:predicted transcriptional regulator